MFRFSQFVLFLLPAFAAAQDNKPFVLDVDAVPADALVRDVRKALAAPIHTIVDKARPSPSGDAHDYISYGRYWWPDPSKPNGLPYIQKDGHPNRPVIAQGDGNLLGPMIGRIETLALGWSRLHDASSAQRAGEWVHAWFVAPATRLNPAFEYAQIRLGRDHNRGSASGLIDTRKFVRLIDALRLLHGSPGLSAAAEISVRKWFSDYLQWLTTSHHGRAEHEARNNHGTWYLTQVITIARYLGRDDEARTFAEEDFKRLDWQILPDGQQPLETARTDGLSYSVFNLEAQLTVARLAAPLGVDLWNYTAPGGGSLKKALDYLRPYADAPEKWPHNQLEKKKPSFLRPALDQAAKLAAAN